jgi:hypothetical protein
MSLKPYFFILFLIFGVSTTSVLLLLFYMNPVPTESRNIALLLMGMACFLMTSSFLAPALFFMKKIYYRGDVTVHTMNGSLRQAILITLGAMMTIFLVMFRIYEPKMFAAIWAIIGCVEVMIQAIE